MDSGMTKRTRMIRLQYGKTMGGSGKKNILDYSRVRTVKTESINGNYREKEQF